MRAVNGWTGGQYSLYRMLLGAYLFVHFSMLLPYGPELFSHAGMMPDASTSPLYPLFPDLLFLADAPAVVVGMLSLAVALSVCLAIGWRDRIAALLLWYVWACLFARNPLIADPGLPYVGWLLLAHAVLPPAPYGSWAARGRTDPGAGWRMPAEIWAAAWILMAVGYAYSGYAKLVSPSWLDGSAIARVLENPLARPGPLLALPAPLLSLATWSALAAELLFAPLALVRALRPWLWGALASMHLLLMLLFDFVDLSFGMLMLHAFTFNPDWVRSSAAPGSVSATMYYDGACGLCHRTVRFVLAEDRSAAFRFSPLDSESFRAAIPGQERAGLPDSIVVVMADGEVLVRSAAILRIAEHLGGVWRVLAILARALPRPLRDRIYDQVARQRRRLFATPDEACPLLPAQLRDRFDS